MTDYKTIVITYCGETAALTCNLAEASAPLLVNGSSTGYQTASARHRVDLAVAIAAREVWPESQWPDIPSVGEIPDDWSDGCDAWDELAYETITGRLTGHDAIEFARQRDENHCAPRILHKYADPIYDARSGLTVAEAEAIATEDPSLIWIDVEDIATEDDEDTENDVCTECGAVVPVVPGDAPCPGHAVGCRHRHE